MCVAVRRTAFVLYWVSARVLPTSVSLPAWMGHVFRCSQSSGVVWLNGQQVCSFGMWMCLRTSHRATLVRNGSCSLRSRMCWFWQVGWDGRWSER